MEALPEVGVAAVREAGLPGLVAPVAVANWLLPAVPKESGPAAASAGPRSCGEHPQLLVTVTTNLMLHWTTLPVNMTGTN